MIVTNFVDASNYIHISNEFSMFSYWSCCMLFSLTSKKLNASLATWCAPKRSRSRNICVRNVFRALIREQHLLFFLMFKICYVFAYILRPCPPEHTVRNVWRALSRDHFSTLTSTFRIRYVFPHFEHACSAHHSGHSFWRASQLDPDEHRRGSFRRRERHACEEA